MQLLDYLFENPVLNVQRISEHLDCTFATASKLVEQFEQIGLLREITGQKRNRQYEYGPYMRFWKTAQDDYGEIPPATQSEEVVVPSKELEANYGQLKDSGISDSLIHIRRRLAGEATEIEWNEQQEPPTLRAQFKKDNCWMLLRFDQQTHDTAELHPSLDSIYIYKAQGPHVFASFGKDGRGADIVWAFKYQTYNERPAFRPAWEHNPWIEPLSAAEVGKLCGEQLVALAAQK